MRRAQPRRRHSVPAIAAAVLVAAAAIALTVGLVATASPSFYSRYSRLQPRYKTWLSSKHRSVSCSECHAGGQSAGVYRLALVGEFYRNLAGRKTGSPTLVGIESPTRESCLKCHEDAWSIDSLRLMKVPHPAHVRVSDEKRDCVKCHKWVAHSEKYQERHKSVAFTGICSSFGCHAGTKSMKDCRYCHHTQSFAPVTWRSLHPRAVESRGANSCLDYCHKITQCRTCHTSGKNPFSEKGSAPKRLTGLIAKHSGPGWDDIHGKEAQLGKDKCFYCHGSVEACRECHSRRPAFHGQKSSWLQRHQKAGKRNETRCLACHAKKECVDCHNVFKEGR